MDNDAIRLGGKIENNKKENEKKSKKDNFKFDPDDKRFDALHTNHLFHIDPSTQGFKKTQAFDDLLSVKINKKKDFESKTSEEINQANVDNLIKSVKNKTKMSFASKNNKK